MAIALDALLADYQILTQKLRAYHWNVRGPLFFELHAKFEALYGASAENVDALAERILARGGKPISTLAEALATARLSEDDGQIGAQEMISRLIADLTTLNGHLREAAEAAEAENDRATVNLLDGMADEQEKAVWMLRASQG